MIGDPAGASQQFADQDIQDTLDDTRNDLRYEALQIGPTLLNAASTGNVAATIFADYYSRYQWWESDAVIQGNNIATGAAWIVLTPTTSDYITGHWTFEANIFTAGTAPGQYPPVFATGKVYDLNLAAADLLDIWCAAQSATYDFSSDGQSFRRSQVFAQKEKAALFFRRKAKPMVAKMRRRDVNPEAGSVVDLSLTTGDVMKGV